MVREAKRFKPSACGLPDEDAWTRCGPPLRVRDSLLALEPRILFDAAVFATGAEVAADQVAQEQAEAAVNPGADTESTAHITGEEDALFEALATHKLPSGRRELVFLDTAVQDYQTLLAGIDPSAEVVLLDAGRDGVEQIAVALAERSGIEAIHIISHGSQAELQLGTARLTLDSMVGEYADELAVIGQALTDEADILVYGCNFGEGDLGQEAASRLAELTGAELAASDDPTGAEALGGDWDLEYATGEIETAIAFNAEAQQDWLGLLIAPTIGLPGGGLTYAENDTATEIDSGATLSDPDSADFDTGTLTVDFTAGGTANDRLTIAERPPIVTVSGSDVMYDFGGGPVVIGTFTGGTSGADPLAVTFNGNSDVASVRDVMRSIAYENVSDDPSTSSRTVRFVLTDGDGGTSNAVSTTIDIIAENDAPVVLTTGLPLPYTENDPPTPIDPGLTVSDVDSLTLTEATVSITSGFVSSEDVLAFTDQLGITGSYNAGTGILQLTGSASVADYQTALRTVTYENTSSSPDTTQRTISFVVDDGDELSVAATRDITVTDALEAPPPPPPGDTPGSPGDDEPGPETDEEIDEEIDEETGVEPGSDNPVGVSNQAGLPGGPAPGDGQEGRNTLARSGIGRSLRAPADGTKLELKDPRAIPHTYEGETAASDRFDEEMRRALMLPGSVRLSVMMGGAFMEGLNSMSEDFQKAMNEEEASETLETRVLVGSSAAVSAGLFAWVLRGGTLLAGLLSTLPAWNTFDPLPILGMSGAERKKLTRATRRAGKREDRDFTGLRSLIEKAKAVTSHRRSGGSDS